MEKANIEGLYLSGLALTKAAQSSEDYAVRVEFLGTDTMTVCVMNKRQNYESLWYHRVENISHDITEGFLLIGQAIGFMDGRDYARQIDFVTGKPLEETKPQEAE